MLAKSIVTRHGHHSAYLGPYSGLLDPYSGLLDPYSGLFVAGNKKPRSVSGGVNFSFVSKEVTANQMAGY